MFKRVVFSLMALSLIVTAEDLKIAGGAGYKKPLMDVIKEYEKSGKKVDAFFGNMQQVSTHVTQTNIALIIGDKSFLSNKSQLKIKESLFLGEGKVVIVYPKGKSMSSIEDLMQPAFQKIAMPEPQKAIYGIAGEEFLKNSKQYDAVQNKLLLVTTVPQALTYVIANEVDVAIVNLTAALGSKDELGGYIEVPKNYYTPIEIVAGKLEACNTNECNDFLNFLSTQKAKDIFKHYGM